MEKFKPKEYEEIPDKDELENQLSCFIQVNGNQRYKVGSCKMNKLGSRYSRGFVYKPLTQANVFCTGQYETVVKIESLLMNLVASKKMSANSNRDKSDKMTRESCKDSSDLSCVYLTTLIEDLSVCAYCSFTGSREIVQSHMAEKHEFSTFLNELRSAVLVAGGSRDHYWVCNEPKEYRFVKLGEELICQYCDETFESVALRMQHAKTCNEIPFPPFPCFHSDCGMIFISYEAWKNHNVAHDRDEAFKSRNYPCSVCGQKCGILRHQKWIIWRSN